MSHKDYFKHKKITVLGLGENAGMVPDIEFLARAGAHVIVSLPRPSEYYDEVLRPLQTDKDWSSRITYRFGGHKLEDFRDRDMIIRDPAISLEAAPLCEAISHNIPIEVPSILCMKLSPPITIIGVTGTSGKTTVASLINLLLKKFFKKHKHGAFYYIDPYEGVSPLSLIGKIEREDVVLIELSSVLLEECAKAHISPQIAVITNLEPDHLDIHGSVDAYYAAKLGCIKHQTYNNFLIANDNVVDYIKSKISSTFKAKILRTSTAIIPNDWHVSVSQTYMWENISLAVRVAEVFKVPIEMVQEVIEDYRGLPGRVSLVKKVQGVPYYNNAYASNPYATLTALTTLAQTKNIILMWGGADRGLDMQDFIRKITQYVDTLILIPGSGTLRSHRQLMIQNEMKVVYADNLNHAVLLARDNAAKGNIVLFSPSFGTRGVYEYDVDRSSAFVRFVKQL